MCDNDLNEKYQYAYKQFHSIETVLFCVANDICCLVDEKKAVLLVLFDLSAAFETVDDSILLDRMVKRLGIQNTSMSWF